MNAPVVRLVAAAPERAQARRRILFWARFSFILVGAMPWWLPMLQALLPLGLVGTSLELPFMFLCHQLPERTIVIMGEAMPLCSRCAGIFTGLALGAITCWPRLTIQRARILLALGGLLMLADVVTQDLGMHPVWHATRLVTGGILGWLGCAALMTAIIKETQPAEA
jgi:uncharacterized membrane protein